MTVEELRQVLDGMKRRLHEVESRLRDTHAVLSEVSNLYREIDLILEEINREDS